jgi:hypothetical protein
MPCLRITVIWVRKAPHVQSMWEMDYVSAMRLYAVANRSKDVVSENLWMADSFRSFSLPSYCRLAKICMSNGTHTYEATKVCTQAFSHPSGSHNKLFDFSLPKYHLAYRSSLPIEATLVNMPTNTPHRVRSLNTQLSSQYLHEYT